MGQGGFSDFMSFKTLISTAWIKAVYAVGAVLITLGSLVLLFSGGSQFGGLAFLLALVYFAAGNLGWRMLCEAAILFFSMHEQLVTLVKLSGGGTRAPMPAAYPSPMPPYAPAQAAPMAVPAAWPAAAASTVACPSCGMTTPANGNHCAHCGGALR